MAPFYRGYEVKPKLNEDDIKAIQALYGKKTNQGASVPLNEFDTENTNEIEDDSPICKDPKIDAIVTVKDNTTYVFKKDLYYKLSDDSIAEGYPRSIFADWNGLPSNIDAAFTWKNGKTYFFKGDKYWRYTNRNKDTGYPKPIQKGRIAQCENFRIFLPLRFYVKSILENLEVLKLQFEQFQGH